MSIHRSGQTQDKTAGHIAVVYRAVDSLTADPRNPRQHSRKQIGQIASSIRTFGFNVPILINGDSQIIAGHGRLLAAQELGFCEVPTIRLEHLTEAQRRAFMIAENRLTEIAVWDDRLLAEQLKELCELNLDFNLEATGFDMGEIDLRIESLDAGSQDGVDPADAAIPSVTGPPVSRLGDLWLLGRHMVYCGSALDGAAYDALLQGEQAALVFTDPPYNVPIQGHVSGLGAIRHREFAMASGEMTEDEFTRFLGEAMRHLARHSVEGAVHYYCMDWRHMDNLLTAGRRARLELLNLCVWVKHAGGMGSLYRSQHELVFVFKNGRAPSRNNVQLGQYGRNRTNVWSYPGASAFGRPGEEGHLLALHPTVKPAALVADAILDCSARGELVLDPYLGSGTTVIAAERTGRRCRGIEIDPLYVDTVIRRWQSITGAIARNAATKQNFDESAAAAENLHVRR
jgi:DNA modification methylase